MLVNNKIIETHVMSLVYHDIGSGGSKGGAPPTGQIFYNFIRVLNANCRL